MRINRTVATAVCIAMLAFAFLACEDEKSSEIKSVQMPDGRIWMAKNLDIATGKSECYDKDPANCQKCGRLYDWETAIKACPKGWRLPTDAELSDLAGAIGGAEVGKALKSKESWDGTDAYGFSVLPCGRGLDGKFDRMGDMGALWSADEINAQKSWVYGIINADNKIYKDSATKARLYSVRCIKGDAKPTATEQANAPAPEKPKVQSIYIFNDELLDPKNRYELFRLLDKKDPCADISNPVKQQDCKNNKSINDILDEIERERIGKIETFTNIGNLSSKPETKMLCDLTVSFRRIIRVFDKEKIDELRNDIAQTNAARRKAGERELQGSEITKCLTLFENRYVAYGYDFGKGNYVLFANKEEAMNYEPKEGNEYKVKLRNIVYYVYIDPSGPSMNEGPSVKYIYDYVGHNVSASKKTATEE